MRPTLELCMIVKNGAAGLDRCLRSAAGVVDRMTIGDTGSSDETGQIARRYGAQFLAIPWEDDFAKARNQVLSHAAADWILVLDSDEMLDDEALATLPALLSEKGISGYDIWRWNYVRELGFRSGGEQAYANPGTLPQAKAYPAYFLTDHTRLFRRDARIRFEHCVHENVVDSFAFAGLLKTRANFVIHHFGYVDDAADVRSQKDSLYHRLSLAKLAAASGNYQAHLEVGMAEFDHAKQPAAALHHFTMATSIDPRRQVGWLYRGMCLTRLGRYPEALHDLQQAATLNASNPLLHSATGDVHFQTANYAEACRCYEKARILGDESALSHAKLGAAEVQLGRGMVGLRKVQKAGAESSASGELLDILATTALLAGDYCAACDAADRRLSLKGATGFHFLLAATIQKYVGNGSKAEMILRQGLGLFPDNPELLKMLAS